MSLTRAADGTVTGNTYDKYGSANPIARRLMTGFERHLDDLLGDLAPISLLDVGCGEGVLTERFAAVIPGPVVGIDLEDPALQAEWERRAAPNLEYRVMAAEGLPFAAGEFDVATALEVLEHVPDPEATLAEMARVAGRALVVSVPREPLWRGLNLARGAYVRALGNTPGHLHHWSKASFVRLLTQFGRVSDVRSPFPWTMVQVAVDGSGARVSERP